MVKPLAMLPPDGPVAPGPFPPEPTHETLPSQAQVSNKVAIGTGQKEDDSLGKGAEVVQGEEISTTSKAMKKSEDLKKFLGVQLSLQDRRISHYEFCTIF